MVTPPTNVAIRIEALHSVKVPTLVEAKFHLECPRTIDCSKVCEGQPSCCVNGQCICQKCANLAHKL
ncbi:hypothetical protein Lalb_Chr07g0194951 [Lupinus albus]|uniref:Uncharacterized protein n=1 Tax=Lupinus albus TaxID=3870 RepID=A0A6A4QC33_LUPAL|nr:hypothetical protein Lalb_Chr07g0194951 [Lupinus albus]